MIMLLCQTPRTAPKMWEDLSRDQLLLLGGRERKNKLLAYAHKHVRALSLSHAHMSA